MNKKLLIGIIVAVVVIALIIGGVIFLKKGSEPKNLDLVVISEDITNKRFAEMAMAEVDRDILSNYFQVDIENVEEIYGKVPMMSVHASMYVLIKAVDGKVENVKQDLEKFGENYEKQWETYLPEQYDFVLNRKIGTIGDYAYLVVAENAEELVELIK